ncbi:MAG: glutaredoxin family protein [Elainellaceae cyanobacterium]
MRETRLILYSKPGCHLCEGLEEKLAEIELPVDLEIRDITTQPHWWERYRYEIPVLHLQSGQQITVIPRFSPRASAERIEKILQKYMVEQD